VVVGKGHMGYVGLYILQKNLLTIGFYRGIHTFMSIIRPLSNHMPLARLFRSGSLRGMMVAMAFVLLAVQGVFPLYHTWAESGHEQAEHCHHLHEGNQPALCSEGKHPPLHHHDPANCPICHLAGQAHDVLTMSNLIGILPLADYRLVVHCSSESFVSVSSRRLLPPRAPPFVS